MKEEFQNIDDVETFEQIEVNLDDELKIELVGAFVSNRLNKASQQVFNELCKSGNYVEDALFQAVLNDVVLEILKDQIEKQNLIDMLDESNGC